MDEIFKPFLSGTTPSPPKFNVIVTWSALAPMDEKNQTPNITFANTRAETLRFGGAGVQHSACCRVWIFCPSTVSFSDVFTSFGLQTLLFNSCCWSSSKLRTSFGLQTLFSHLLSFVTCCFFLREKYFLFLIRRCLMLFKLQNPLAGPRQTNKSWIRE